jgi:hypothetical protein
MRLDDIIERIGKNPRVLLFAGLVLLLLSVFIGVVLGIGRRPSPGTGEVGVLSESGEEKKTDILMPEPVLPQVLPEEPGFIYYFDRIDPDKMDFLEFRISDLLMHRRLGAQVDIKPFVYRGEELDIVAPEEEIAEP